MSLSAPWSINQVDRNSDWAQCENREQTQEKARRGGAN